MTTFKLKDRVLRPGKSVAFPGESETTIVAIFVALTWTGGYSDKPCEVYMLADGDLRTAEQLEPAPEPKREPKREPKAGEVWNLLGFICHVLLGDRVSGLNDGTLYFPETNHAVLREQGQFLAESPAAYFKGLK